MWIVVAREGTYFLIPYGFLGTGIGNGGITHISPDRYLNCYYATYMLCIDYQKCKLIECGYLIFL